MVSLILEAMLLLTTLNVLNVCTAEEASTGTLAGLDDSPETDKTPSCGSRDGAGEANALSG